MIKEIFINLFIFSHDKKIRYVAFV